MRIPESLGIDPEPMRARGRSPGAQAVIDRRAHRRLPLTLHVEFQSDHPPPRTIEKGLTADVSAGGLRVTTFNWRQLPIGRRLWVTISLPFESVIFTDRRRLTAPATVVRWMDEEDRPRAGAPPLRRGVAVRFDEPLAFVPSL